jgi:hypothetical protein
MPAATLDELYRSHFHRILKAFKAAFAAHDIRVSSLAKILNDRAVAIGQPYGLVWSKNIIIPIKFTAAQFLAETTFMTPAYPMITLHRIFLDPKTFQHLVIALIEELSYLIYGPVPDAQKFAFYAMVRQFGLEKLARLFREMDYGAPLGTGQIFARFIEHELIYRIAPYATPSEQAAYLEEHSHLIDQLYEIVDAYIAKNFPALSAFSASSFAAVSARSFCVFPATLSDETEASVVPVSSLITCAKMRVDERKIDNRGRAVVPRIFPLIRRRRASRCTVFFAVFIGCLVMQLAYLACGG